MAFYTWNGPGNWQGALPGARVKLNAEQAEYLRSELGDDCIGPPPKRPSKAKPEPVVEDVVEDLPVVDQPIPDAGI